MVQEIPRGIILEQVDQVVVLVDTRIKLLVLQILLVKVIQVVNQLVIQELPTEMLVVVEVPVLLVVMHHQVLVVQVELESKFPQPLEILRVLQQTHQIQNHPREVVV